MRKVDRQENRRYRVQLTPTRLPPLQIFQGGSTRPTRLLYFTKDERCLDWINSGVFPKNVRILSRYGPSSDDYIDTIRKLVKETALELLFVGDLDPYDLSTFAILRNGSISLAGEPRDAIPVRYLGIDDRWLQLCLKYLKPAYTLESITVEMSDLEREHFELVREMVPDLAELVGPRCLELLMSGCTLDVIGASNLLFYKKPFWPALLEHFHRARPAPVSGRRSGSGAVSRRRR